jgi:hypothetical protein
MPQIAREQRVSLLLLADELSLHEIGIASPRSAIPQARLDDDLGIDPLTISVNAASLTAGGFVRACENVSA